MPEENSQVKVMTTVINTREEEHQKATYLITLKTLNQEGDDKAPEENP